MTQGAGPKIRFFTDAEVGEEIVRIVTDNGGDILSKGPAEDPGRFAFDFGTVTAVVTLASALLFKEPVIPELCRLLRRRGDGQKVVIEGPHGRVELGSGERPLGESEIRAAVELVAGAGRAPEGDGRVPDTANE
ncbi:hypothetical protein [Streptomyces sp. AF1A]|jgi:hypothetical protein|uniref:hypothetical protein n=1 Tax=Streptomyces sp. AF1A TaxID=3394350 RepID=UPI0039BCE63C